MKRYNYFFLILFTSIFAQERWGDYRDYIPGYPAPVPLKERADAELRQILKNKKTFDDETVTKIKSLISSGADKEMEFEPGKTPLIAAIEGDNPYLVSYLSQVLPPGSLNKKYMNGFTPLAIAAYDGKIKVIPVLLRYRADINTRDNQGNTPLILATRLLDQNIASQIAQMLIDAGIDIDAQNNLGETALYRAVAKKKYQLIQLLSNNGANPIIPALNGQSAADLAVGDQQALTLLRKKEKIR